MCIQGAPRTHCEHPPHSRTLIALLPYSRIFPLYGTLCKLQRTSVDGAIDRCCFLFCCYFLSWPVSAAFLTPNLLFFDEGRASISDWTGIFLVLRSSCVSVVVAVVVVVAAAAVVVLARFCVAVLLRNHSSFNDQCECWLYCCWLFLCFYCSYWMVSYQNHHEMISRLVHTYHGNT